MNVRALLRLTKPGVMLGNLITTVAGLFFASRGNYDWTIILATTVGTALVISSACVINNYLDQDIDSVMERTKNRPLITGEVSPRAALIFGITLGGVGLATLTLLTNWLVVAAGIFGWVVYVWLYGELGKRRSMYGTLVGNVSGAVPILAGYVAVSGRLDWTALLLFIALFCWQVPEFYSIAIFRLKEYKEAGIPLISVMKGVNTTKRHIFFYTLATVASMLLLSLSFGNSYTYFVLILILGARWMQLAGEGLITDQPDAWSKRMFHYSLIMLVLFSVLISIDHYLV